MIVSLETLSKLLDTSFRVSLNTTNVDTILVNKIKAKLEYWSSVLISLTACLVMITLFFFKRFRTFLAFRANQQQFYAPSVHHSKTICVPKRNKMQGSVFVRTTAAQLNALEDCASLI